MIQSEARVGMKVYFGRERGEKTLGEIVKVNPAKAKVKTLEARGMRGAAGVVWSVPYEMMTTAPADAKPGIPFQPAFMQEATPVVGPKLVFQPFQHIDNLILQAIWTVYCELSPEWLTADGERTPAQVAAISARLHRQLNGLFQAYGRRVEEVEVLEWDSARCKYRNIMR